MILYLARKYVVNTLVFATALALIPILFGGSPAGSLPSAFFWGSVIAAGYTYRRFQKKNIWPLYDNLRLPQLALFAGLFVAVQLFNLALALFV